MSIFVIVLVMRIGKVVVRMSQRVVDMRMTVRYPRCCRIGIGMLVMLIVLVFMLM